jgi:hypothetical protein
MSVRLLKNFKKSPIEKCQPRKNSTWLKLTSWYVGAARSIGISYYKERNIGDAAMG